MLRTRRAVDEDDSTRARSTARWHRRPRGLQGLPGRWSALFGVLVVVALVVGCGTGELGDITPSSTARSAASPPLNSSPKSTPTQEVRREEPTPSASPTPEPTPEPTAEPEATPVATVAPIVTRPFSRVDALVIAQTTAHSAPSMAAGVVRTLPAFSTVSLVGEERGQNWIIGDQDWVPLSHEWERTWYRLDDGSYVYRAFVWVPDGPSPLNVGGGERYVIVDLGAQTAYAMAGITIVRQMPITTGKAGFDTPAGEWRVLSNGRILNERMTSQRAGFDDPSDTYDVQRVLYTQYFAEGGFALHLNYWQPESMFGTTETSHGCVGLLLPDAQFLWAFAQAGTRVVVRNGGGATPLPPPPPQIALATPEAPRPETSVKIFATQDGAVGAQGVVAARTVPLSMCTLVYTNATGGRRELQATASADGWLEWKWTIEAPPGRGSVLVNCPGGSATADFVVR